MKRENKIIYYHQSYSLIIFIHLKLLLFIEVLGSQQILEEGTGIPHIHAVPTHA